MMAHARFRRDLATVLRLFVRTGGRRMLLGGLLATLTVLAGVALLGLSGWFITATALAGLSAGTAVAFNVFLPSAGIRLLALGRTAGRYAERVVTHDATFAVLAALRERLFRGWAQPQAAHELLRRPARLLSLVGVIRPVGFRHIQAGLVGQDFGVIRPGRFRHKQATWFSA